MMCMQGILSNDELNELIQFSKSNDVNNDITFINKDYILDLICDYYKLEKELVLSKSRKSELCHARNFIYHFLRKYTKMSLKDIGLFIGGRDHATVINGFRNIDDWLKYDNNFKREFTELEKYVENKIKYLI